MSFSPSIFEVESLHAIKARDNTKRTDTKHNFLKQTKRDTIVRPPFFLNLIIFPSCKLIVFGKQVVCQLIF
jgi:hypothetical protein